ncbi:MAG: ABC transporter permease subunit [bacterium JZ-2024 1]
MSRVLVVAHKEFLEVLRDFRTLFILLFLPVLLYPVLVVGVAFYVSRGQTEQEQSPVIVGISECPMDLIRSPHFQDGIRLVPVPGDLVGANRYQALEKGRFDAIVDCSGLSRSPARPITVYYLSARTESYLALGRLEEAFAAFRESWFLRILRQLGFAPDYGRAFQPEATDLSPPARVSGFILAQVLPLVLVLIILQGAYHPAMDLVVGERERKTVESLLASPLTAWEILAGKALVISIVAWLAGVLNLTSLVFNLSFANKLLSSKMTVSISPGFVPIALVLIEMVPLAILFASLFVGASAFSRTFRESQSHLVPVVFLVIAPATVMFLAIPTPHPFLYAMPVFSSLYVMKATLTGTIGLWEIISSTMVTLFTSVVLLRWGAFLWTSERILYGVGESPPPRRRARGTVTATEALAIFLVSAFGVFQTQPIIGQYSIPLAIVTSHLVIMGGSVVLLLAFKRAGIVPALRLVPIAPRALVSAILFGFGAICLSQVFSAGLSQTVPPATDFNEKLVELIRSLGSLVAFVTLAVLPSVFEELLFRGLLVNAFIRDWGLAFGLVLSSVLFGLMHAESLFRILQTTFLGVLMAYVFLRCGSLLASMLVHLMVNSFSIVLVFQFPEVASQAESEFPTVLLLGFAVAGSVCWLLADGLLERLHKRSQTANVS